MPSVLITGPLAWRDPGEEAVLAALVRALPGWEKIVTIEHGPAAGVLNDAETVSAQRPRELARSLVRADAVIATSRVIDGAPGAPRESATLRRTAGLLVGARSLGKPAAMVGVGSGPLPTRGSRVLARTLVRRSDLLVLRDRASARSLGEAGAPVPLRVGADLAWTALGDEVHPHSWRALDGDASSNGHRTGARTNSRGSITVALDSRAARVELIQRLAISLERLAAAGIEIRLQPWSSRPHGFDDVRLAGVLAGMIDRPVRVLAPPSSLQAAVAELRRSGAVVALRYHAQIAAAAAGAPCLAVAHEPDLGDLADRLGQPSVSAGTNPPELVAAMIESLDHAPPGPDAVGAQIESADESVRLLRMLLSEGNTPELHALEGLSLEPAQAR